MNDQIQLHSAQEAAIVPSGSPDQLLGSGKEKVDIARTKKQRLRKTVTIRLSDGLSRKVNELAKLTGATFRDTVLKLAEHGAERPVEFVVLALNPDSEAGVHLNEVEKVLARVSMALRDHKGLLHRYDEGERAEKLHEAYASCLELWDSVQKLSSSTFYSRDGLIALKRLYMWVIRWQIEAEESFVALERQGLVADPQNKAHQEGLRVHIELIATALRQLGIGRREVL